MRIKFLKVHFEATYPNDMACYVVVDSEEVIVSTWDDFHGDAILFKKLKEFIGYDCAVFEYTADSLNVEYHAEIVVRECIKNNITFKLHFTALDINN